MVHTAMQGLGAVCLGHPPCTRVAVASLYQCGGAGAHEPVADSSELVSPWVNMGWVE